MRAIDASNVKECSACLEKKGEEAFQRREAVEGETGETVHRVCDPGRGRTDADQTDLVERLRLAASQRSSLDGAP